MIERRKLTLKETFLLFLGCALFFSTAFAIIGPLASQQTSDEIAAYATDGVTATGKVTGKPFKNAAFSYAPIWRLDIEFKTAKGEEIHDSPLVTDTIYDHYAVGDPVRGTEPKAGNITMFEAGTKYAGLVAGASLIGILVVVFAGRGGGAPKDRAPTKSPAPAPSPARQGPRAEFGARRRA